MTVTPTRRLVAGVDSSTQSTKVVLVDPDDGTVHGTGQAAHTVSGLDGARESDPDQWWTALRAALGQALGRLPGPATVVGIAVGAQQHGLVCLDPTGAPVRPALLWNDTRSADDADGLLGALGGPAGWARATGSVPVAALTAAKWAWLRRCEPEVAARVAAIRLPHDYLTERLCGRAVTDRGDASGTGWYDAVGDRYLPEVLELPALRLDPALLPEVLAGDRAAGTLRADAADLPGLSTRTVVAAGTGDNMAAALALVPEPGQPVISLGTSGTAYTVSATRPADETGTIAGFAGSVAGYLPLACTLNCTQAVDRMAALLGRDREAVEPGGSVVVLPFLDGERTPNLPHAAGLVDGLRHDSTPGQVLRAAYEGAVVTLLDAAERIAASVGAATPASPILLIGGGSRGATWRHTLLRLSGRGLQIPAHTELVALGAAVQAAAAVVGAAPDVIARRWRIAGGTRLPPVARDEATLARVRDRLAEVVAASR